MNETTDSVTHGSFQSDPQGSDNLGPGHISSRDAGALSQQDNNDEDIGSKPRASNTKMSKSTHATNDDDTNEQQSSIDIEGKNDPNVFSAHCPNHTRIREMQESLGKLLRMGILKDSTWVSKNHIKENQMAPCHFVDPQSQAIGTGDNPASTYKEPSGVGINESQESRNNPVIVVEKFANATIFGNHSEVPPENLCNYAQKIKSYGFDHIIVVGKSGNGVRFLDCYGRMFECDFTKDLLWSLGDWSEHAKEHTRSRQVAWKVTENGTVSEFNHSPDESNIQPLVRKVRKNKNKQD